MRILVTADLHYQPARRADYVAFARRVEMANPDCLVVAGDIGHPLRLFRRGLQLFAGLSCPRLLITGNHDVYRGDCDSRTLWEARLPDLIREEGFVWLEETTWRLGSVGICGTMGWYDYSARSLHLPFAAEDYPHLKKLVNHDADYIDWPWSDRTMARFLAKRFTARLEALEHDPAVTSIVVVTHMPVFAQALPPYPQSETYSLQRAFLGNFTLGDVVQQHAKVSHVVSGHLHRAGQWHIAGHNGGRGIQFHLVGSEKGRPDMVLLELPG